MKLPRVDGRIARRILVNFRIEPGVARRLIPRVFDLTMVDGAAMAGVCLIRLERLRPVHLPGVAGLASDNVAYRFAVTWQDGGMTRDGVYIPRRDTSSALQARLGGRIFPGEYGRASVRADERGGEIAIDVDTLAHDGDVHLRAHEAAALPSGSVFASLDDASAFLQRGAAGYSATRAGNRLDGLLLTTHGWSVRPLSVDSIESSFFDDTGRFPPGSVIFDNALIMRNLAHDWRALPGMPAA
jgi:uncharacterized protein YqjF (DUF2071 family)